MLVQGWELMPQKGWSCPWVQNPVAHPTHWLQGRAEMPSYEATPCRRMLILLFIWERI